jgi:hypothetical protein
MPELARIPLEGGGSILVEAPAALDGPVKAGRIGDALHIPELPVSLQQSLSQVADTARAALDQLRKVSPAEIEVEFGVDLAVQAGVVITKSTGNCHLKVKLAWKRSDSAYSEDDE